jgi:hypothetical protein
MIVRWQCSSWGASAEDYAWAMLDLAQDLMRWLEPNAEFHVTHQYEQRGNRGDTAYHHQVPTPALPGPSWGKFYPSRFDINQHEIYLDNDILMWELPRAWKQFRNAKDKALGNLTSFGYHGLYSNDIRYTLNSGFFGLPLGYNLKVESRLVDADGNLLPGANHDQEEMGGLSYYLCQNFDDEHLLIVDEGYEVPYYNPLSAPGSLFPVVRRRWGRYGIHLSGANRRHFNPMPIIDHIRSFGKGNSCSGINPFPKERAEECRL